MSTKTALITGSSRGIGYGIAESLAKQGFNLAINGVRDEKDVTLQLKTLLSLGVKIVYCRGDIGKREERKLIVEKAFGELGKINVLVNNAGVAPKVRKDILELDEDGFDYVMDINLKGTFFLSQDVALRMVEEKRKSSDFEGCIITITSISADVASINRSEYCIAKAGLAMMTKLLATRLGEVNIPVYEVRPGIIDTDMTAGVKEKYDKLINDGLTIEKRWGNPNDIGKIVAALAVGNLPYSTGQVINVDGGMNVRRL